MVEPRFVSKEELIRRQGLIDKDRLEIKSLRTQRLALALKGEKTKEIDDKINFYISDMMTAEKSLKSDMKAFSEYEQWQYQKELQASTLPAERENKAWTDEELIKASECPYNNDDMVTLAKELQRTFYGVEHVVRAVEVFNGKMNSGEDSISIKMLDYLRKQS